MSDHALRALLWSMGSVDTWGVTPSEWSVLSLTPQPAFCVCWPRSISCWGCCSTTTWLVAWGQSWSHQEQPHLVHISSAQDRSLIQSKRGAQSSNFSTCGSGHLCTGYLSFKITASFLQMPHSTTVVLNYKNMQMHISSVLFAKASAEYATNAELSLTVVLPEMLYL